MPDETNDQRAALPDMHPGNVAPMLCKNLCVPGCIVLTSNADGSMMMVAHGIEHARANEMLSRAVQINLNQHDECVRAGVAGDVAAKQQSFIDAHGTACEEVMQ